MAGLAPVAYGMMGLTFALFLNAAALLGIDMDKQEGMPDPTKTLAIAGSLSGAITLFFQATWFVIGAPLGTDWPASAIQLLFSITPLMYALIWLALAYAQWYGLDARYVGNAAFMCIWYQLFFMGIYGYLIGWNFTLHDILVEITLLSYVVTLSGFWAVTHGKFSPKAQGGILIWAGLMTIYLMIWAGGILPPPT